MADWFVIVGAITSFLGFCYCIHAVCKARLNLEFIKGENAGLLSALQTIQGTDQKHPFCLGCNGAGWLNRTKPGSGVLLMEGCPACSGTGKLMDS